MSKNGNKRQGVGMGKVFAYADPPYLGCCRLYGHNHPDGGRPFDGRCWDDVETHRLLLKWLDATFDGWAYSLHSNSLRDLAALSPIATRTGAWVKPFCSFKPGVRPAYAWEPVFYKSSANPPFTRADRTAPTPRDFVSCNITLKKGLTGAKPLDVCRWLLDVLHVRSGDTVVDVFPGSAVAFPAACKDRSVEWVSA